MSYDPTREWNITSVDITLANDNGHFLYVKVPVEADVTTSEVIASEAHIDPLRDEGYIIYKLGWITPVVDGKRTAQMLWGNNKPIQQLQSDWNQTDNTKLDFIKNKPSLTNISVQALSGTTVSWNVNNGVNGAITLSGNTTITLSNLVAGTSGNLSVTNPSTLYTLTVSGYTNKISQTAYLASNHLKVSGSSKLDVFSWYYDGTYLWWNGGQDYK